MHRLVHSTDSEFRFELVYDRRHGSLEGGLCIVGNGGPDNGRVVARFSMADLLLEFERMTDCSLRTHRLLDPCARVNLSHGAAARDNLEERRVLAFRRASSIQLHQG